MKVKKWNDWKSEGICSIGPGHFHRSKYPLLQKLILAGWEGKANFRNIDDDDGMDIDLKMEFSRARDEKTVEHIEDNTSTVVNESDEEFLYRMEKKTRFYGRRMTPEELKRYQTIKEKMKKK